MKQPILYISLGTIISNKGFCKECIRAFKGKDLSVILNTGGIAPQKLGRIPDNLYAFSFVPQLEVLEHVDAFLTHCGMSSVNEAMAAGVPMIAMPFMNDQIGNVKRIVELGIGKRIKSFPSRSKEMYQTTMSVLKDEKMRERSLHIQEALRDEMSLGFAIDEIERLLS